MVGETFRATVIGQLLVRETAIVFDFGYADLSGSAHIDTGTAAGAFQTLVQASLAAVLANQFVFKKYRFACVGGTHVGEIGYVDVAPPVNGTAGDEALPPELAISLKRSTGYASRRDRGRIFLGPVSVLTRAATDGDEVDITIPALSVAANLLKADLTVGAATLKPVILSSAGSYSGHVINHVSIGSVYVHHKSRRTREGA